MTSPRNKHPLHAAVHFFKIILTTSLAHGKLKLPRNFIRKYGNGMSNPVFLKPPDGSEWKIYWTKHDGEIWFQKGWKEFATYHSLDHGHLLFFRYEGTSHFDVHIFDNSAVEVDYPSHGTHDGKDTLVQISDDSVEILDEQCSCQKTRAKSRVSSPQPRKKMKNSITTNVERSPNGVNFHQHDQTRSTSSQEAKFMRQTLDEDEGKGIFNTEFSKVEQSTSIALNKVTTFKSKHPSFLLVMKPSFINGDYLEIPPQFSEQYLKKAHAVVLLEVIDGRSWPVICSAPRFTGGWQKFASENNLNVGDVCVFELIQKIQSLAFKVSIFRGAEEPSSLISQDLSKCSIVYPSTNWRGGSSSQISSRLESHFESKILPTRAIEEASKFTSENPFFMFALKLHKNITRYPHVPSNFVRKYFVNMNQNVMLIQFRKKLWPVKFVFNEYNASGKLSAGWPLFSRENKLQPGDVCIFELVNREDAALDVHVFRGHSKHPSTNWTSETSTRTSTQRSSLLESYYKSKILTTRALEEASKFTSQNPFFTVTLTLNLQANIARCPRVPSNFVSKYFVNMNRDVMMIQFRKKLWPVTFLFNECDNSGTLSAGWSSFARENKLQPGDVCIFELVNREDATLDLHVFRGNSKAMQ
ncbi:B3 domain-containing transcription factor VRN1 [Spatholobus suberectus]|nr:B3 domain-containing transcription factor VRN1 [Spatholobus suberectus]